MGNCQSTENEQGYLQEQQQLQEKQLLQNKAVDDKLSALQSKVASFDGMSRELKSLKKKVVLIEAEKVDLAEQLSLLSAKNAHAEHSHGADEVCPFGQSQSPIDIALSAADGSVRLMSSDDHAAAPLSFNYPSKVGGCTIQNTGHTVQVNIDAENNKCLLSIHGKTYSLKQFHFHTPSEHTLSGEQFEMEMHLVHTNEEGEIAVLGFIFTVKAKYQRTTFELTSKRAMLQGNDGAMAEVDSEEWDADVIAAKGLMDGNDFLAQFWDELPMEKTTEDIPLTKALCFDHLFEAQCGKMDVAESEKEKKVNMDMEIFEYKGSLTTPPYSEGVQWLLNKTTHFLNNKQLKKLSACWRNENNARDVQEYFGRTVLVRSESCMHC